MRVIRVFPRRTRATPLNPLVSIGEPTLFDRQFAEELEPEAVHVSVTFTWDIPRAERIAGAWEDIAPVRIGGPALGDPGGDFEPGFYLAQGYTITSRGCPNRCWFCRAWRAGGPQELPVRDGWIVQDDNLLACSEGHIRAVFSMLARQSRRANFAGGLEAARLADWHVDLLASLKPRPEVFFAYDTPDDYEPLAVAAGKLFAAGFTAASHRVRCYVLIGYPRDSMEAAEDRLNAVLRLGITPAAMLYRDFSGATDAAWRAFQRRWMRPAIIHATGAS